MKIYIVIPQYIVTQELKELATNAIKSFREASKDIVIVSVDDGSTEDVQFLKDLSDIYIRNEENMGFAKTCNRGFEHVFELLGDEDAYIVCANNDIEVYQGWQEAMMDPFDMYDNVAVTGLVSSKHKQIEGKHISQYYKHKVSHGGLLNGFMQSGGLWMSKKSVLEEVGLFDERYEGGGMEDVDLFLRMRDRFRKKIIMSAKSMFWHKEGATRWNEEMDFKGKYKAIETENEKKFEQEWGFAYRSRQVWREELLENAG